MKHINATRLDRFHRAFFTAPYWKRPFIFAWHIIPVAIEVYREHKEWDKQFEKDWADMVKKANENLAWEKNYGRIQFSEPLPIDLPPSRNTDAGSTTSPRTDWQTHLLLCVLALSLVYVQYLALEGHILWALFSRTLSF